MCSAQWAGWRRAAASTLGANPGLVLSALESRCNTEVLISPDRFKGKVWFFAAKLDFTPSSHFCRADYIILKKRLLVCQLLNTMDFIDLEIKRGNTLPLLQTGLRHCLKGVRTCQHQVCFHCNITIHRIYLWSFHLKCLRFLQPLGLSLSLLVLSFWVSSVWVT